MLLYMKKILIVLDGGCDSPKDKITPLSKARTPALDKIASKSILGAVYPIKKGIAPESDIAVMSILGYDPIKYHTGRGPLEMYGTGLNPKNFLALRVNFATKKDNKIVDRRVARTLSSKEAKSLCNQINKKVKLNVPFILKHTTEHRAVLVFLKKLSAEITNTDPSYKRLGKLGIAKNTIRQNIIKSKPLSKKAKISSGLLNEFVEKSSRILERSKINKKRIKNNLLPANFLVTRDAGNALPILPKKRNFASVVGMPLEIGISKIAGIKVLKFNYAKTDKKNVYKTLFENLKRTIIASLKYIKSTNYKYYYIHFKETDIPGHDGKFKEKKQMIELLDKEFFAKLTRIKNIKIVLTCDHATPVSKKGHSSDKVPVLISNALKYPINQRFTEKHAIKGKLKITYSKDILNLLQKL